MTLETPLVFEPLSTVVAGLLPGHVGSAHVSPRVGGVGEGGATGHAHGPAGRLQRQPLAIIHLLTCAPTTVAQPLKFLHFIL